MTEPKPPIKLPKCRWRKGKKCIKTKNLDYTRYLECKTVLKRGSCPEGKGK